MVGKLVELAKFLVLNSRTDFFRTVTFLLFTYRCSLLYRFLYLLPEVDEKKRKMMMPESIGSGSFSGAPPKYRMVYTRPEGQLRRPQQQQNWGNLRQFQSWQFQ
jgi:hypothetical protein